MENQLIYQTALSWNIWVGPKRYQKILSSFGSLKPFFELSPKEQIDYLKINSESAIQDFKIMLEKGEKIIEICKLKNIQIITQDSIYFPNKLKELDDAPFVLYSIGNLNYSLKLIGMVGTRDASPEALTINEYFARELTSYSIGIVSGLALGHDCTAQRTALENDGYSIAVLGTAIDHPYPKANTNLYRELCEKGAVISELPPGAPYNKTSLVLRNRLISGLSDAVLLIQAPLSSGALITLKFALAQNREIYVVPGNPLDPSYAGSNQWIQSGAKIALFPEEIARDLLGNSIKKLEKLNPIGVDELKKTERQILSHLKIETTIDDLIAKTQLPISEIHSLLTHLEIRGLVTQYPGQYYISNYKI